MRWVVWAVLAANVAVIVSAVAIVCAEADVTPLSWVRIPACFTVCWLFYALPASSAVVAVLLIRGPYRGTAARMIGLPALITLLALWALFLVSSPFWSRGYAYEIRGAQYSQVAGTWITADWTVQESLPPQSRDIHAWIRPFRSGIAASFRVGEEDFVSWAAQKQWALTEVHGVEVSNISTNCDPNDELRIEDGLLHRWTSDEDRPWVHFRVYAYDRTSGLGYLTEMVD